MIKKVVNKPQTQVIVEFPAFDLGKRYLVDIKGSTYELFSKNGRLECYSMYCQQIICSYSDFQEHKKCNPNAVVYVLDHQDELARFILGCREFPKLEEIDVTISQGLADNEVSVDSKGNERKIYAALQKFNSKTHIYKLVYSYINGENSYCFKPLDSTDGIYSSTSSIKDSTKEAIKFVLDRDDDVYQFDTQEEFLTWALEQTTDKKFSPMVSIEIKELASLLSEIDANDSFCEETSCYGESCQCPRYFEHILVEAKKKMIGQTI